MSSVICVLPVVICPPQRGGAGGLCTEEAPGTAMKQDRGTANWLWEGRKVGAAKAAISRLLIFLAWRQEKSRKGRTEGKESWPPEWKRMDSTRGPRALIDEL